MSEVRDSEGNYIIRPHKGPQETFLGLDDSILEAFYGGALGGGKSWVLLVLPIIRKFYKHPHFSGIIFRRTYPQLEEYLIPESKLIYPHFGGEYNESKHVWTFAGGARLKFGFIEDMNDARGHDGHQYNYIGWDELTHFMMDEYIYLMTRLRSGAKGLPSIVRSTSNPGNIGSAWVRERFVEPNKSGYTLIKDKKSSTLRIFIPAKTKDNPSLLENNPNYINQLLLLPEAERKAKMDGDWWAFSGQVFTEFRQVKRLGEPDNALHVIEPFTIPSYWPKVLSLDWGFTHKTAFYAHAISPDGRVFTYHEIMAHKRSILDWGADIGRFIKTQENIVLGVIDPSANKNEGHPKTIKAQVEEATEFMWEDADNDRVGGKMNMHDFLRWSARPKRYVPPEGFSSDTYNRISRLYGIKAADQYHATFQPEKEETNIPRWQIFSNCSELVKVLSLCVYDEKKVEDVSKFTGDDSYDSARYGLKAVDLYIKQAENEFKKFARTDTIVRELQHTGDQNRYYQQMDALERKEKNEAISLNIFKVRRGAKGRLSRAFGS